jgi:MshEN domain
MANKPKIGELLLAAGAINKVQLGAALADQRNFGRPLGSVLVQMGYLDEETLIRTLGDQLDLPVAWLRGTWVDPEVIDLVPAKLALKHRVLPLAEVLSDTGKLLYIGMQDPHDLEALDAIRFKVGHKIQPVLVPQSELDDALKRHYESAGHRPANAIEPRILQPEELRTVELQEAVVPAEVDRQAEPEFELVDDLDEPAPPRAAPAARPSTHAQQAPQPAPRIEAAAVAPSHNAARERSAAELALDAVIQLLTVLLRKGVVTKAQVTDRLCLFLSNGEDGPA